MCDHRLHNGPLTCVITTPHTTHVYHASDCPDAVRDEEVVGGEGS